MSLSVPTRTARAVLFIAVVFMALYIVTRTYAYSYDGLIDALAIERGGFSPLFHPNHLLYPSAAWLIYHIVAFCQPGLRALNVMQSANAVVAGLTVGLFFVVLERAFGWRRALLGAVALGLSQAFWVEAVDPGAYAWSTLAVCLLLDGIVRAEEWPAFQLGLIHGFAIVMHQLLVLAVPAVLMKIGRPKARSYLTGLCLVTGIAYILIAAVFHSGSLGEAIRWIISPPGLPTGGSAHVLYWWTFSLKENLLGAWSGFVHEFIAVPAASHVKLLILESVGGLTLAAFLFIDGIRDIKERKLTGDTVTALWVWILTVNVFLFFYIPGAVRFRLLVLPPLIYLILTLGARYNNRWIYRVGAVMLVAMATLNYRWVIAPQAQPENNPSLVRTLWVSHMLKPEDVFLFAGGTPDSIINIYLPYFAPHVKGRSLRGYFFEHSGGDLIELRQMVLQAHNQHQRVFVEAALFNPQTQKELEALGQIPAGALQKWLDGLGLRRAWRGLADGSYGMYGIR